MALNDGSDGVVSPLAPHGKPLDARPVGSTTLRLLAMVAFAILLILVILPAVLRAAGIQVAPPA
ncbi:MAG: hypothetical protein ABI598_04725 [Chloroflexota bacterium]